MSLPTVEDLGKLVNMRLLGENHHGIVSMAVVSIVVYGIYKLSQVGKRDSRMPPGPPTTAVLGNILDIPTTGPGNMIVICDRKAVYELIDRNGSIYSDRPPNIVPLFITRGNHMTMECRGPSWRAKRPVVTRNLNPKSLDQRHFRVREAEAVLFMNRLLTDPDNFYTYARLYPNSVAAILAWGFRAKDTNRIEDEKCID
ncbi:hypothetical protein SAPIO_CDS6423 [Scedosporium apiospermum]|uniref:Uncharacterized protein n=1 Tax=Pseudallescheria apiosperma TaxID=563466 RepID=A0A084G3V9_PSEDA|nr:uncharacterized protein SAPIO_CDS6423 [Scedosporium apiospermum]KEZ42021.1 hypothetical protein SAPIO_CDS6423 [Scedosporium apiospermum]